MRHVVLFSGGIGSWAAAKRVAAKHGTASLVLLFADTLIEDEDLYRFLREGAANVGGELVVVSKGETPWDVFRRKRFFASHMGAPCSRELKTDVTDAWLEQLQEPFTLHVGIDWSEAHRFERLRARKALRGWTVEAPLCEPPWLTKQDMFDLCRKEGIEIPRLYTLGLPHNNCGGFCVRMGTGGFARFLRVLPERYREHEAREAQLQADLSTPEKPFVRALMRRDGQPMTMRELRERTEAKAIEPDLFDIGGCGCYVDDADDDETLT